jgi:hypothetical protein
MARPNSSAYSWKLIPGIERSPQRPRADNRIHLLPTLPQNGRASIGHVQQQAMNLPHDEEVKAHHGHLLRLVDIFQGDVVQRSVWQRNLCFFY